MKKLFFLILALVMFSAFTNAQDFQLPKKGNNYISFGYTPFVTDVSSIKTSQDDKLITVGYGHYFQNDLALEGNFGIASEKNKTSYAIGGNVVYNFPNYKQVSPFMVGGAMFTGINNTDSSGTLKTNVLTLSVGLGVEYFFNANISLNASYKLNFDYAMKPKHSQMEITNVDEKFNLGTGIGKIGLNIYW